jgi:Outer membrane protein beta-barrel domain
MVRRLSLMLGLALLVSLVPLRARAQDKIELFGGYSFMRVDATPALNPGSGGFNLNGWEISGQYKLTDWLGGVADFDGHSGSPSGVSTSIHTFLFGPQVSWPTRVSPFAHVLVGGAHVSTGPYSDSSLSLAIGGGIDTKLVDHFYWRIIEGDYLLTHFFGNTQSNVRASTGIVFKF